MKISKIFLILIIGIISLNAIFAGQITQKSYMIKGDLIITDTLRTACSEGKSWDELMQGDEVDFPDDDQGGMFSAINNLFDQLFFAAVTSKCDLEVYSPTGTIIKTYKNLNADGIKEGLNLGFLVGPVNDTGTETQNFIIKIRKQSDSVVLLETTVKTLNPSAGIGIYADDIKEKAITAAKLNTTGVLDDPKILSWDEVNEVMRWKLVGSGNLESDSIQWRHLSGPVKGLINSKISKMVYTKTAGDTFTSSNKYLQIPVTEGGVTTMYYLQLSTLDDKVPLLNIVEDSITELVGQTAFVDAIIENVDYDSLSVTVTGEGYYDIITINGAPDVITEDGVTKARVSFTCNTTNYGNYPLITINGTFNQSPYTDVSDSIYVTCNINENHDPEVEITNQGAVFYIGTTYDLTYTSYNVSGVNWTVSGPAKLTNGGPDGKRITCNAGSDGSAVNITLTGTPTYPGYSPVTDTFSATCKTYSGGGVQPPGSCFLAGTKVYTTNGWKNIETIKSGEKVYSYSNDGKLVETNVKSLLIHDYVNEGDKSVKLELSNNKVLFVTTNHAFYSPTQKAYRQLKTLNIGDDLLYYNVTTKAFENVQISKITELPSFSKVYNLALDTPNNYLAEGVVVHNDIKGGEVIPGGGVDQ